MYSALVIFLLDTSSYSCPQLSLIHDCIPERVAGFSDFLLSSRQVYLSSCSHHLCVSRDTAEDLSTFYGLNPLSISWCHPAPSTCFYHSELHTDNVQDWRQLQDLAALPDRFILLPGTSSIGSYKSPEIIFEAMSLLESIDFSIIISGIGASRRCSELKVAFPCLSKYIIAAGFTNSELTLVYRKALAVIVPSTIEGFGLPVIEVLASGGIPIIADSRGLREAGSESVLSFPPGDHHALSALLALVASPASRAWISHFLRSRSIRRLNRLNPDLFGLVFLTICRQIALN